MELSNKPWLDQKGRITINSDPTILIHIRNGYPNMQANKFNTKYYLHVQYSTNATTQGNCIKDIKSNKGTRVMYLKKMHII